MFVLTQVIRAAGSRWRTCRYRGVSVQVQVPVGSSRNAHHGLPTPSVIRAARGAGWDVAGHTFRTGKPSCHPSRTHAPSDVLRQPTPHPPVAEAGPARANTTKEAPTQAKRIIMGGSSLS